MIADHQQQLFARLVADKLIRDEQIPEIENLMRAENKTALDVLIGGGFAEEEKLTRITAEVWGIPYVNLTDKPPAEEIVNVIPQNISDSYQLVCFERQDKLLKIALAAPENIDAQEAVDIWSREAGYEIDYYICSKNSWQTAFGRYSRITEEVQEALGQVEREDIQDIQEDEVERIGQIIKKAPVAKIVNLIFLHAVKNHASDIHIEPLLKETRVRYRIDGILQTTLILPLAVHDSLIARIKVLANLKIDETRIPQDGRIKMTINNRDIDFRVSVMPLLGREKITLRILDTTAGALSLAELGFSELFIKIAAENFTKPFGMFLITGPTGSGKSTTLYSILNLVNKEGVNIVTLEDPIEYYNKGVNQAQIRPDVGFTFASGLRALLRQDPDIIMVGEIRDNETAEMAIHAALTGHLLFSTLHTNNAVGAVARLIDMKVEPFLLASTINAIAAQRLTRRICPKCREPQALPAEVQANIRAELKKVKPELLPPDIDLDRELAQFQGRGCPACKNSGYLGRVVIAEILPVAEKLRPVIADGFNAKAAAAEIEKINMITLLQDGLIKVLQGVTTAEEVFRVAAEVDEEI